MIDHRISEQRCELRSKRQVRSVAGEEKGGYKDSCRIREATWYGQVAGLD